MDVSALQISYLLLAVIFLINIAISVTLANNTKLLNINKIGVAFIHSLMVFCVVVLFLNTVPGYFTETIDLYKKTKVLRDVSEKKDYIKDNFVLINTSHTNSLVRFEGGDVENDCSNIKITNRKKLLGLLNTLIEDSAYIDLVVCDLIFPQANINDTIDNDLASAIGVLAREDKIIVAQNLIENASPLRFNNSIEGNVNIDEQEENFIKVPLLYNNIPTISYKMYCMINKITYNKVAPRILNENGTYVYDEIIPTMPFTDEAKIYDIKTGFSAISETVFLKDLGDVTTSGGKELLSWTLKKRKKENKRNIIMIGEFPVFPFSDSGQDVHNTPYGKLYGSTIILNLFYELEKGHHKINLWQLLSLWITIYVLSFKSIISQKHENNVKYEPKISKRILNSIKDFISKEIHFGLLIVTTIISFIAFYQPINIMVLGIYFYIFQKTFNILKQKDETEN